MQTFIQILHNEYIRFTLATALICVAAIAVWLLLRRVRLWYNETESVLGALDTISGRLEQVEDKLGLTKQDASDISENIYAISNIAEESKSIQMAIHDNVKDSKESQEKIAVEVSEIHGWLLADSGLPPKKECDGETSDNPDHVDQGCEASHKDSSKKGFYHDYCEEYDDYDDIEDIWLEELEDDFLEDDEDEIRKKIRL